MKHAGPKALDALEGLLVELRSLPTLGEKSRGVFYRKSRAFLHFHEHGDDLYADLRRPDGEFERYRVTDQNEWAGLMERVASSLSA